MESKVEEIDINGKYYRVYKVDYSRLEKGQGYKSSVLPKVANIGYELEAGVIQPAGTVNYTHFISIPLIYHENIVDSFIKFKDAVLSNKDQCIDQELFNKETNLHITIIMLELRTKGNVQEASKALVKAWNEILENKILPVKLHMKGLEKFGKHDNKTNVVYGKLVEDEEYEKLVKISDIIIKAMIDAKVLEKSQLSHIRYIPDCGIYRVDKFHMTVLNTKYKSMSKKGMEENECVFNSTGITKLYNDFDFGIIDLKQIELSCLTKKSQETGYYYPEVVVKTEPENNESN